MDNAAITNAIMNALKEQGHRPSSPTAMPDVAAVAVDLLQVKRLLVDAMGRLGIDTASIVARDGELRAVLGDVS